MSDELKSVTSVGDSGLEGDFIVDEATDEVLRLHLDKFEGPLEVLLYLIKSQEIDILDIPILTITQQYLRFLELMREEDLEVTGDFLVMAATLIHIKSRMLLPADVETEEDEEIDEEDPRLELVEKLLEYRRYREVAERLQFLEQERERWYARSVKPVIEKPEEQEEELLEVTLYDLIQAFRGVLRFFTEDLFHTIEGEGASVDEKIEYIEGRLATEGSIAWTDLFKECRSRIELVCCFLAILEMCRMGRLRAHQHHSFEEIRLFPPLEDTAATESVSA
ncbi:MAG: segregation/condensation protein A [Candidatus Hydrogenedentes bacterium]|nr:segregation/condensation protein A [Candidatus Hydrogenedentota bacterium]